MHRERPCGAVAEAGAAPRHVYTHSPKIIAITGMPASGKTTAAEMLRDRFGYEVVFVDAICAGIIAEHGISLADLDSFQYFDEFKRQFLGQIREKRYKNLVIEGFRINHEHVLCALLESILATYGDYAIIQLFHLDPGEAARHAHFRERKLKYIQASVDNSKNGAVNEWIETKKKELFSPGQAPLLRGFTPVSSAGQILAWAARNAAAEHPALPVAHKDLIKEIAECGAFNPFYQAVEVGGRVLIRGFTDSWKSWERIQQLQLSFHGQKVCDIGCMLGYFSFKAEEQGGLCTGYDIDAGAIAGAWRVAAARRSACRFEVRDATVGLGGDFDIVLALNVLHRVNNFEAAVRNILSGCRVAVLEVGERQMPPVLLIAKQHGFRLLRMLVSHRNSNVVGQRVIALLTRQG